MKSAFSRLADHYDRRTTELATRFCALSSDSKLRYAAGAGLTCGIMFILGHGVKEAFNQTAPSLLGNAIAFTITGIAAAIGVMISSVAEKVKKLESNGAEEPCPHAHPQPPKTDSPKPE